MPVFLLAQIFFKFLIITGIFDFHGSKCKMLCCKFSGKFRVTALIMSDQLYPYHLYPYHGITFFLFVFRSTFEITRDFLNLEQNIFQTSNK